MDEKDLLPLMVFQRSDGAYLILLSAEHVNSLAVPAFLKRGRDEMVWMVAVSYKGNGCQIHQLFYEEILKCRYLGFIPVVFDL